MLETVSQIAAIPPRKRTPAQARKLAYCFLNQFAPKDVQQARQALAELRKQRDDFDEHSYGHGDEGGPASGRFHPQARCVRRSRRKVSPGLPHVLPPLPAGYPNNRLGLARWLVSPRTR